MLQTMPRYHKYDHQYEAADTTFWAIFVVELLLRVYVAQSARNLYTDIYVWIDVLAILPKLVEFGAGDESPDYLQIFRGLRMLRLLKTSRHYQGSTVLLSAFLSSMEALVLPFFFLMVAVSVAGSALWGVEVYANDREWSIPQSIFWLLGVMTTGYADVECKKPTAAV